MKKIRQWWKTECVRAARGLGGMLLKAVISVILAGMIAFCAYTLWFAGEAAPLARIGYTAEDDRLTALALAFVENMESVNSFCQLVPVTEEEGREQLLAGELSAWLVLPEDVVDGILSGNNRPAILYRRAESSSSADAAFGRIFEALAEAGVNMLKTAQAEIYATSLITERFSYGREFLEELYQEIDLYNLRIVLSREQLFRCRSLSATGNEGIAVYYGSGLLTLYLLLLPCFLGSYGKRSKKEIKFLSIRGGIPGILQLIGRILISMGLLLLMLFPTALFWLHAGVRESLQPVFSGSALTLLLLSLACTAVLAQLVYLSVEKSRTAFLWLGVLTLTQGYAAGCLIPSALLPESVAGLGAFLPAAGIKAAFSGLFSGTPGNAMSAALLLGVWTILLLAACLWQQGREERTLFKPVSGSKNTFLGTGLVGILTKRLLWQKSVLCCLGLTVLGAGVAVSLEGNSKAALYAAVYDEAGTWQPLLEGREGLVQFLFCESEDEVKRYVMQGKAECGYVLQEDLQTKIEAGEAAWSITVYESADALLTKMVNEVLFERLFYGISSEWYEGYIAGDKRLAGAFLQSTREETENAIKQAFLEKYTDESTFAVETRILGEDVPAAPVLSYPVDTIAGLCLLLCAILGTGQACTDTRLGRFRGRPHAAALTTILLPTAGALLSGILSLAICGQNEKSLSLAGLTLPIAGIAILYWLLYRRTALTNTVCRGLCELHNDWEETSMAKSKDKTNAMRILDDLHITYGHYTYECKDFTDGVQIADMLSLPREKVYKTLVTKGSSGHYFVFVIPVAAELDRKKAAKSVGEKSVELLPVKELNAVTGYIRGGCTAIGMKKPYVTRLAKEAENLSALIVSGGKLGFQIELSPQDFLRAAKAEFADITVSENTAMA